MTKRHLEDVEAREKDIIKGRAKRIKALEAELKIAQQRVTELSIEIGSEGEIGGKSSEK